MRFALAATAAVLLAMPAAAQVPATPTPAAPAATPAAPAATPAAPAPGPQTALEGALRNYPPFGVGANVHGDFAPGSTVPRSCPPAGSRVEQKGGPTMEYNGASPTDPDLCLMKVGGEDVQAWYGIWATAWPGADYARRALQKAMGSRTGDVVGFDTVATPDLKWHDLIRLEGIEDIKLLGKTYTAMKLSHYREGFDGNTYRSVSTIWKDVPTGMLIYGTYQHISGQPELDDPLIPTAIVPAP